MAKFKAAKQRKIKTSVEGLNDICKLLEDMGVEASNILQQAAEAGGRIALAAAKKRCPADTGALKESLYLENSKTKNPQIKQEIKIAPGKNEFYGTFVELGTSKQKAQPYMRPAVDENQHEIAKAINDEVIRALKELK
jgi:HK97 gp10 family phage protein